MEPKFESNQAAFMPKKNAAQETELQKLNDELVKTEESFESMRRSMPLSQTPIISAKCRRRLRILSKSS